MKVVIDGINYVPAVSIEKPSDDAVSEAIRKLVSMQYFGDSHDALDDAWSVLLMLAPDIAELAINDPKKAYDVVCGSED